MFNKFAHKTNPKKKEKPIFKGIQLDSKEELEFIYWLEEAQKVGLIKEWQYHPETFRLSEPIYFPDQQKAKFGIKKSKLYGKAFTYTPDFLIGFNVDEQKRPFIDIFNHELVFLPLTGENAHTGLIWAYVDVKGLGIPGLGGNDSAVTFPIKQAWTYQKHGVFVNKVIAKDMTVKGKDSDTRKVTKPGFFARTWVPLEVAYCKGRKTPTRTKPFENCKLLSEILDSVKRVN